MNGVYENKSDLLECFEKIEEASDQLSARAFFKTTQAFKQYTIFTHKIIPITVRMIKVIMEAK